MNFVQNKTLEYETRPPVLNDPNVENSSVVSALRRALSPIDFHGGTGTTGLAC